MIKIEVEQGSAEWRLNRYGIFTASEGEELVTPAKWQPTTGERREKYVCRKIAERIVLQETARIEDATVRCSEIEYTLNRLQTDAMLHGVVSEPRAVSAYEFLTGNRTEPAGFILNDARTAGASIDRMLFGTNRGLEIKSPFSLSVYVGYCFSKGVDAAYLPQLMSQMWIAELESVDIYAWFEGRNESEPITVPRDDERIQALAEQHTIVNSKIEERWQEWQSKHESVAG